MITRYIDENGAIQETERLPRDQRDKCEHVVRKRPAADVDGWKFTHTCVLCGAFVQKRKLK